MRSQATLRTIMVTLAVGVLLALEPDSERKRKKANALKKRHFW